MLEKSKLSFDMGLIAIQPNTEHSGKETEKYARNLFMIIIVWMVIYEMKIEFLLFLSKVRDINN